MIRNIATAPPELPSEAALTPDTLFAYCRERLRTIDQGVAQKINAQRSMIDQKDWLQKAMNAIPAHETDHMDRDAVVAELERIKEHFASVHNDDAVKAIDKAITSVDVEGDTKISPNEIADAQNAIKSADQELDSHCEMNMIELQSMMSQRQQAIQLSTNLIQSIGQQLNMIAQNVGK